MLAIRMQRTGRRGHAQFRVVVQDSRFNPKSGRVVAYLGSYNPHTKDASLKGEELSKYLENGAQPSERVARLLQKEGINLPKWVKLSEPKARDVRNPEKRRSTAPKETTKPQEEVSDIEDQATETTETPTEEVQVPEETQATESEASAEESAKEA